MNLEYYKNEFEKIESSTHTQNELSLVLEEEFNKIIDEIHDLKESVKEVAHKLESGEYTLAKHAALDIRDAVHGKVH